MFKTITGNRITLQPYLQTSARYPLLFAVIYCDIRLNPALIFSFDSLIYNKYLVPHKKNSCPFSTSKQSQTALKRVVYSMP